MRNRICTVNDCDGSHYGRGYCVRHYRTWQKHGVPVLFREPDRKKLNDERLDELHRSDPYREFSIDEIAEALGAARQSVYGIERRALKKIGKELHRRGIGEFDVPHRY
jgi:DNA-directed RNA polymerase specialized sigma subunit